MSDDEVSVLTKQLLDVARSQVPNEAMFEVLGDAKSFVSEHNKPPGKSLHELMIEREQYERTQRAVSCR